MRPYGCTPIEYPMRVQTSSCCRHIALGYWTGRIRADPHIQYGHGDT